MPNPPTRSSANNTKPDCSIRIISTLSGTAALSKPLEDLNDIQRRNDALGFDAQIRQSYFISCWTLFGNDTAKMWHTYAPGNGVMIVSTYSRLKSVLDPLPDDDKAMMGLIRYGADHLIPGRRNLMVNVSTKRVQFKDEKEVRAMLWIVDPHETGTVTSTSTTDITHDPFIPRRTPNLCVVAWTCPVSLRG